MDILKTILDAFSLVLANGYFVALCLGLVITLAGTQWLKFRLPVKEPWKDEYRWFVRLASLPLGVLPTWFLWPDENGWAWGLAVGFSAPWVYKFGMAIIYRRWPDLEKRLSANPYKDDADDSDQAGA